jgi:hypothetical protein
MSPHPGSKHNLRTNLNLLLCHYANTDPPLLLNYFNFINFQIKKVFLVCLKSLKVNLKFFSNGAQGRSKNLASER